MTFHRRWRRRPHSRVCIWISIYWFSSATGSLELDLPRKFGNPAPGTECRASVVRATPFKAADSQDFRTRGCQYHWPPGLREDHSAEAPYSKAKTATLESNYNRLFPGIVWSFQPDIESNTEKCHPPNTVSTTFLVPEHPAIVYAAGKNRNMDRRDSVGHFPKTYSAFRRVEDHRFH